MAVDPGEHVELSLDDLREVARFALGGALQVLDVFERLVPDDPRPRAAVEAARVFADGAPRTRLQRVTSVEAHRAAREAPSGPARHAARSAGDAVAAAYLHPLARSHQLGHLLGADVQAACCVELLHDDPAAAADHLRRAVARATHRIDGMSLSPQQLPGLAAAVVSQARAEVLALADRLWAAVGDDDLVAVVEEVAALRATLSAVEAAVLVELDVRQVPRRRLHWSSTAAWYAHCAGETTGTARRTLRRAHDLVGDRAATWQHLCDGAVSATQAGIVCDRITDLPSSPRLRLDVEAALLAESRHLDATQLAAAARHALATADPDGAERRSEAELAREDRAAHAERFLAVTDDGYGGVRLRGRGSLEDAAVLRAALLPLTRPTPSLASEASTGTDTADAPGRDPRDHGARVWDALVGLAQHALDTHLPPESHGTSPRVAITIDLADLHTATAARARTATTDDGLPLHPAVARRLACDAEIIPLVLGTHGEVLDVGRAHRTTTPAIWRALVTRDRHCAFPACTRPPLMCHAHHLTHWADGGPTALHNLVLLCGEHHRRLHDTPWRVRLDPTDHRPEFLPPARSSAADPPTWVRSRDRNLPRRE